MTARLSRAALVGAAVGIAGGLIGLGGAEFRLPFLIGMFGFVALEAVILNKAMSLVVVTAALIFRARTVAPALLVDHWAWLANVAIGSLPGAWLGASWATRLRGRALDRVIALLLLAIAAVLLRGHDVAASAVDRAASPIVVAFVGLAIGVVAAVLGVAGGELLIPAFVLLYGADARLAGSLSLAVSLPTMLVSFSRYARDRSFVVIRQQWPLALAMAAGSTAGAFVGGRLLGVVPSHVLLPILSGVLVVSAWKIWRPGESAHPHA